MRKIFSILLMSVLMGCSEGELLQESEKQFASEEFERFVSEQPKSWSELQSLVFSNDKGVLSSSSGGRASISFFNQTYSFRYVQCFNVEYQYIEEGQYNSEVVSIFVANNEQIIDLYNEDFEPADYLIVYVEDADKTSQRQEVYVDFEMGDIEIYGGGEGIVQWSNGEIISCQFNSVLTSYATESGFRYLELSGFISCF